ncbi:MAG: oligosaccharide flippase family protein [bacterium]|nr:oligosaccharide flippase family protein [bacterium]
MASITRKITHIFTGDILSRGIAFIITIYLARSLGTEGFGLVSIAMAYLGYLVFFADFGLFNIASREVARDESKRNYRISELLILRIFMALSVLMISWFLMPFIIEDSQLLSLTRGFMLALIPHSFLVEWYFIGVQRYKVNALSNIIKNGVYLILILLFVDSMDQIPALPFYYVTGLLASAVMLIWIFLKDRPLQLGIRGFHILWDGLKAAITVGSGSFFAQVIQLFPPIAIGYFLTTSNAGEYSAAFRLIIAGMLIDRIFVQLLIPNLSKQWSEDKELATLNMDHTMRLMLVLGALASIGLFLGAPDFILLVFGNEFENSISIVMVLSFLLFVTFQNSIFSHGLVALGKDLDYLKATSIGGAIGIVLIAIGASQFGVLAVAAAVVLSEFFIGTLAYYWYTKHMKVRYIMPFILTILSFFVTYKLMDIVRIQYWVEAIIGAVILFFILLFARVIRKKDINWFLLKLGL